MGGEWGQESGTSSMELLTALLPKLALTLTKKLRPTTVGSSSVWRLLAGMIARPLVT